MRRSTLALALLLAGCPTSDPMPSGDGTGGPSSDGPEATASDPSAESTDSPVATSDSGGVEPWLEVGWGVSEFNAFEDVLPIVIGPQGLAMFSLPLRGAGFYNPPDPGFDNPDMPMLEAWVDVPGYAVTPDGHLNEVTDYPALFYPSLDEPGVLEGPAVWLVIPDGVDPEELAGLDAHLHVEMVDANGVLLEQDNDLVIGDAPQPPPGP